jgi:hypothetical protein
MRRLERPGLPVSRSTLAESRSNTVTDRASTKPPLMTPRANAAPMLPTPRKPIVPKRSAMTNSFPIVPVSIKLCRNWESFGNHVFSQKRTPTLPYSEGAVSLFLYVINVCPKKSRIILSPRIPPRRRCLIVHVFPMIFFQKYGLNGDKVGLIVLNGFLHSALNDIPLFVIPAKAGTQNRDVLVVCAFPLGFPLCFPVCPPLDPRFRGDDDRGIALGY